MNAFHIEAPAGASSVEADFDFISPTETSGFSSGASATTELAVVSWNQLLLYPEGVPSDQLKYQANLRVPPSYVMAPPCPLKKNQAIRSSSSLPLSPRWSIRPSPWASTTGPLKLGKDGNTPHYLHIAADGDAATDVPARHRAGLQKSGAGSGRNLWLSPLSRLSLSTDPQRSHRPLRSGAS